MRKVLIAVIVLFLALSTVVIVIARSISPDGGAQQEVVSLIDRVKNACEAEYGSQGEIAVNDCRLAIQTKYILDQKQKQFDRATSRALQ